MEEFLTLDVLLSLAGCVFLVNLFTEVCKYFLGEKVSDPKWYVITFSIVFVAARNIVFYQDYTLAGILLTLINIMVCFLASIGIYETLLKDFSRKLVERRAE